MVVARSRNESTPSGTPGAGHFTGHPHRLVIDMGASQTAGRSRYVPRPCAGAMVASRSTGRSSVTVSTIVLQGGLCRDKQGPARSGNAEASGYEVASATPTEADEVTRREAERLCPGRPSARRETVDATMFNRGGYLRVEPCDSARTTSRPGRRTNRTRDRGPYVAICVWSAASRAILRRRSPARSSCPHRVTRSDRAEPRGLAA
jgi:hypothetical protein